MNTPHSSSPLPPASPFPAVTPTSAAQYSSQGLVFGGSSSTAPTSTASSEAGDWDAVEGRLAALEQQQQQLTAGQQDGPAVAQRGLDEFGSVTDSPLLTPISTAGGAGPSSAVAGLTAGGQQQEHILCEDDGLVCCHQA